jgi:nitrite reductase/ring-hydroxylating ferredoxin subunit
MGEWTAGTEQELTAGTVRRVGPWAVGNVAGRYFAVSHRCRHLGADLAEGSIDAGGCLVCPWHGAVYDVESGRMRRGPQGVFAKIPGLDAAYRKLTAVFPLSRGTVTVRDGSVIVSSRRRPSGS